MVTLYHIQTGFCTKVQKKEKKNGVRDPNCAQVTRLCNRSSDIILLVHASFSRGWVPGITYYHFHSLMTCTLAVYWSCTCLFKYSCSSLHNTHDLQGSLSGFKSAIMTWTLLTQLIAHQQFCSLMTSVAKLALQLAPGITVAVKNNGQSRCISILIYCDWLCKCRF